MFETFCGVRLASFQRCYIEISYNNEKIMIVSFKSDNFFITIMRENKETNLL